MTDYNITNIVSTIHSPTALENAYRQVISHYLSKDTLDENLSRYLKLKTGKPRFWNCVGFDEDFNRKGGVLWASINPSDGGKLYPEDNAPFNIPWEDVRDNGRSNYWKTFRKQTSLISSDCCHMDLLPIHCTLEPKLLRYLFRARENDAFHLACDLIHCTQTAMESVTPKLIFYSNVSTRWLLGTNDSGWLGYTLSDSTPGTKAILEAVNGGYMHHGKVQPSVFQITGIGDDNVSGLISTHLEGAYIVLDYQVGGRHRHLGLTKEEVFKIWSVVKELNGGKQ